MSTEQVARRLGIKPETVYAYVSRGVLRSTRDAKGSWFDEAEVEALASRPRRRRPAIGTSVTSITDGRLAYRGRDVADLMTEPFESVAQWLWQTKPTTSPFATNPPQPPAPPAPGQPASGQPASGQPASGQPAPGAASALPIPAGATLLDQLRIILAIAAPGDPLRFDLRSEAVARTGARIITSMVDALPTRTSTATPAAVRANPVTGEWLPADGIRADGIRADGIRAGGGERGGGGRGGEGRGSEGSGGGRGVGGDGVGGTLAGRLWGKLSGRVAKTGDIEALNAALVLLADHSMASSTVAARVAASVHANPYAVVSAALNVFEGPLHGAAATQTYRLVADAITSGNPLATYAEWLRAGGRAFSTDQPADYPDGDIRASLLLSLIEDIPPAVTELMSAGLNGSRVAGGDLAGVTCSGYPTIEFALAVLAHSGQMPPGAAEAIFVIARTAGWIAHAMEEYQEPGLRFRLQGRYSGTSAR